MLQRYDSNSAFATFERGTKWNKRPLPYSLLQPGSIFFTNNWSEQVYFIERGGPFSRWWRERWAIFSLIQRGGPFSCWWREAGNILLSELMERGGSFSRWWREAGHFPVDGERRARFYLVSWWREVGHFLVDKERRAIFPLMGRGGPDFT